MVEGRAKLIFGTIVVRRRWRVWDLQALGNCVLSFCLKVCPGQRIRGTRIALGVPEKVLWRIGLFRRLKSRRRGARIFESRIESLKQASKVQKTNSHLIRMQIGFLFEDSWV